MELLKNTSKLRKFIFWFVVSFIFVFIFATLIHLIFTSITWKKIVGSALGGGLGTGIYFSLFRRDA